MKNKLLIINYFTKNKDTNSFSNHVMFIDTTKNKRQASNENLRVHSHLGRKAETNQSFLCLLLVFLPIERIEVLAGAIWLKSSLQLNKLTNHSRLFKDTEKEKREKRKEREGEKKIEMALLSNLFISRMRTPFWPTSNQKCRATVYTVPPRRRDRRERRYASKTEHAREEWKGGERGTDQCCNVRAKMEEPSIHSIGDINSAETTKSKCETVNMRSFSISFLGRKIVLSRYAISYGRYATIRPAMPLRCFEFILRTVAYLR